MRNSAIVILIITITLLGTVSATIHAQQTEYARPAYVPVVPSEYSVPIEVFTAGHTVIAVYRHTVYVDGHVVPVNITVDKAYLLSNSILAVHGDDGYGFINLTSMQARIYSGEASLVHGLFITSNKVVTPSGAVSVPGEPVDALYTGSGVVVLVSVNNTLYVWPAGKPSYTGKVVESALLTPSSFVIYTGDCLVLVTNTSTYTTYISFPDYVSVGLVTDPDNGLVFLTDATSTITYVYRVLGNKLVYIGTYSGYRGINPPFIYYSDETLYVPLGETMPGHAYSVSDDGRVAFTVLPGTSYPVAYPLSGGAAVTIADPSAVKCVSTKYFVVSGSMLEPGTYILPVPATIYGNPTITITRAGVSLVYPPTEYRSSPRAPSIYVGNYSFSPILMVNGVLTGYGAAWASNGYVHLTYFSGTTAYTAEHGNEKLFSGGSLLIGFNGLNIYVYGPALQIIASYPAVSIPKKIVYAYMDKDGLVLISVDTMWIYNSNGESIQHGYRVIVHGLPLVNGHIIAGTANYTVEKIICTGSLCAAATDDGVLVWGDNTPPILYSGLTLGSAAPQTPTVLYTVDSGVLETVTPTAMYSTTVAIQPGTARAAIYVNGVPAPATGSELVVVGQYGEKTTISVSAPGYRSEQTQIVVGRGPVTMRLEELLVPVTIKPEIPSALKGIVRQVVVLVNNEKYIVGGNETKTIQLPAYSNTTVKLLYAAPIPADAVKPYVFKTTITGPGTTIPVPVMLVKPVIIVTSEKTVEVHVKGPGVEGSGEAVPGKPFIVAVPPGKYVVEVTGPGGSRAYTVSAYSPAPYIIAAKTPETSYIQVVAPSHATVTVTCNGKTVYSGPASSIPEPLRVPAGVCRVTASMNGTATGEKTLTTEPGHTYTVLLTGTVQHTVPARTSTAPRVPWSLLMLGAGIGVAVGVAIYIVRKRAKGRTANTGENRAEGEVELEV